MKNPYSKFQNESGIAMMMAITTMVILSILAAELVYQNQVYNGIVDRQTDQLRAKLLARSALRLAKLQLKGADKAKDLAKSLGADANAMVEQIWKTPLILPPPSPDNLSATEKSALDQFTKSLGLIGSLSVTISGESDRLNLNNLIWLTKEQQTKAITNGVVKDGDQIGGQNPNTSAENIDPEKKKEALQKIKKLYVETLDQILEQKKKSDENFRDQNLNITGEVLIGNLIAWMDPETTLDGENRAKDEYYARLETPYSLKNGPLYSESELHMVKGFNDEIVNLVLGSFSIQNGGSINLNTASRSLLQALIPELNNDDLDKIEKQRTEKEFTKPEEFWAFLEPFGNFSEAKKRLDDYGIKFLDKETSYRVSISAQSGYSTKNWMALMGEGIPITNSQKNNSTNTNKPNPSGDASNSNNAENKSSDKTDSSALNIIYLKTD